MSCVSIGMEGKKFPVNEFLFFRCDLILRVWYEMLWVLAGVQIAFGNLDSNSCTVKML